jgi:hypothetical protein
MLLSTFWLKSRVNLINRFEFQSVGQTSLQRIGEQRLARWRDPPAFESLLQ